jgi:hypothetical protein
VKPHGCCADPAMPVDHRCRLWTVVSWVASVNVPVGGHGVCSHMR